MEVIKMSNLYRYKTKCGLEVIHYQLEQFNKSYCGIGTKFGSANLKYKYNDKIYNNRYRKNEYFEKSIYFPNTFLLDLLQN
jgi:hypothetical protein